MQGKDGEGPTAGPLPDGLQTESDDQQGDNGSSSYGEGDEGPAATPPPVVKEAVLTPPGGNGEGEELL